MSSFLENLESMPNWAKYLVGAAAVAIPAAYWMFRGKQRKSPLKEDWKDGVVYLYQFPRTAYIPNLSPFCLKLETWLRMADVNYENVECDWATTRSKEGMLPFVELNGKEHADSGLAIRDLMDILGKGEEHLLDSEQQGIARAFEEMMEGNALWSYAYLRYGEHVGILFSEKVLGQKMPLLYQLMPKWLISNQVKARAVAQGIGRHSREEIINIGLDDLRALAKFLGSKQFIMGHNPTRVDATVFGVLAQILYLPIETPHKELMENECSNLKEYTNRMRDRFWPDWEEATKGRKLHTKWKRD